jgi:Rrf2 family iron-sulfur cluster assembly transcriptional regulator
MQPNVRLVRLPLGTRYAIQGLVHLARQSQPRNYCLLEDVARAGKLPKNYLSKIFQDLARAGLLDSRKGRGGGYALARPAESIRLMEIIEAFQDPFPEQSHCLLRPGACSASEPCVLHESVIGWEKLMMERMRKTTLSEAAAVHTGNEGRARQ